MAKPEKLIRPIKDNTTMNKDSFSFVIYLIHAGADKWDSSPGEIYKKLQRAGCI